MVQDKRSLENSDFKILWLTILRFGSVDDKWTKECLMESKIEHTSRALRSACKDRSYHVTREALNRCPKEQHQLNWPSTTVASCAIKILRDGTTPLAKKMRNSMHVNDRKPHRGKFIRTPKSNIGRGLYQTDLTPSENYALWLFLNWH